MDANQDDGKEKGSCGKSSCGSQCGCRKSCCGAKAAIAVLLFLVAGIIGYLVGANCSSGRKSDCKMGMMASHCAMAETAK